MRRAIRSRFLIFIAILSGCAPVARNASTTGASRPTTISTTLRSFNYFSSSNTAATTTTFAPYNVPLTLEWQSSQSLNADYQVSVCDSNGLTCSPEFTVLCANHLICEVQLASGAKISNFYLNRIQPPIPGSPPTPTPSNTTTTASNATLANPLAQGFQGFHLEICNISQAIVPTNATLLIHAKNSDGSTGDTILGTGAALSTQGHCSL